MAAAILQSVAMVTMFLFWIDADADAEVELPNGHLTGDQEEPILPQVNYAGRPLQYVFDPEPTLAECYPTR